MNSKRFIRGSERTENLYLRDAERKNILEKKKRKIKHQTHIQNRVRLIAILFTLILLISLFYFLLNNVSANHTGTQTDSQVKTNVNEVIQDDALTKKNEIKMNGHEVNKTTASTPETSKEVVDTVQTSSTATPPVANTEAVKQAIETPVDKPVEKPVERHVETTNTIYNKNIPMPKEHQEYLFKRCQKLGLDYKKTLASIKHESDFNQNVVSQTNDYGYFQINKVNHYDLSKKLNTDNSPLNPYINIDWGTYMLSDLYNYWKERGYTGTGLDNAVWSSYNKGLNGFKKHGHATAYINKMHEAIQYVNKSI